MEILKLSFGPFGAEVISAPRNKVMNIRKKGKSILNLVENYTVVDLETTGLDTRFDSIIEIAAIKVRSNKVADKFHTLVNPNEEIDDFITELTGITNDMLCDAPLINDVLPQLLKFIGEDIVIGHNVNFDVNFIYDINKDLFGQDFLNTYLDTMRLSRKLLPEIKHHRLNDLIKYFNISYSKQHRASDDAEITFECYNNLKKLALEKYGDEETFLKNVIKKKKKIDLTTLSTDNKSFDEDNPFYNKVCVFTGTLEKMKRAEAAQLVVDLGGKCGNSVTKKTNYLILGNNDYCPSIKDGKSEKQKRAEELKLKGNDIEIISENSFYDMLNF